MRKYVYHAKVVSVYDGDTVRADIDLGFGIWLKNQSFRLCGIDAPEVRGKEKKQGIVSRDFLREKVLDKFVTIETMKDKKGKYGRWLANIYLESICINELLVEKKLAILI